jgi:acetyl-CoA C-acetyltransferase
MSREVVVVSGVRTAIGTYGGSLKDIPPTDLAAQVVRESLARAGVDGKDVGHVVFGHVVNTEPKDMYLSRVAAINGGCAEGTPAFNVNRLCGSGLQAIVSASQSILLGDTDIAIGGGAENMSRGPYASLNMRWGARMGDTKMIDMVVGALHDPFHTIHMGVTAENVAAKYGITREMQDALAVESHNRAQRATAAGYFKDQIVPVTLKSKKGEVAWATDEHFRPDCKLEDMAKLKPVFVKENGTVTAGNASGINDAAAAVVLMEAGAAKARGAKPLARLVAYAHTGLDPKYHGRGPHLGHAGRAEEDRPHGQRPGRDRGQRGLCRASLRRDPRTRPGPGQGQPQRLRHLAGPPHRRHRRADHRESAVRVAARQWTLRPGDDVHRRRARHCRDLRAHVRDGCQPAWQSGIKPQ